MLTLQGQDLLLGPPVVRTNALSCLQRVAPKGPGVEGTRCIFKVAQDGEIWPLRMDMSVQKRELPENTVDKI